MRALRIGLGKCLVLAGLVAWSALPVRALSTVPYTPPPVQVSSPVIVTGYGFDGTTIIYVQLFNKSDEVIDLSGWQLEYGSSGPETYELLIGLEGLLRPSSYVVAAESASVGGADYPYAYVPIAGDVLTTESFRLLPTPEYKLEIIKLPSTDQAGFWRRNVSESTGNYLSTFDSFIPTEDDTLFGGGLYSFPDEAGLQISEILANPRDCSPVDVSLDCRDYVKLYNPTIQPIDLSAFRLRSGYQGQNATNSNTFLLGGILEPGHYVAVATAADGNPLTLTNGGGYVWLEDAYGIKLYDPTVQQYADAGSDARKGQAWAYDETDGSWKWTPRPTPDDAPSVFPVIVAEDTADEEDYVPCQPNQYRNPETNRCRLLPIPEVTSLAACLPGQYRNPATNRCRKIETVSSLAPCDPGEERNPVTNRCRRVTSTDSDLVPCQAHQERNPETNRCRNKAVLAASDTASFPVEPVEQGAESFVGWWTLGGIGAAAVAYGMWEWHHELLAAGRRVVRYLPFVK